MAEERGLVYQDDEARIVLRKLAQRKPRARRQVGTCHTLILTLKRNWGIGMVSELRELGPVTVFDWEELGFFEADPKLQQKIPALNALLWKFVFETHSRRPVDWILVTCSGNVILRETIRRFREDLDIATVNQWLDCKQNFEAGPGPNGQDLGQKDIAPEFDVVWTSSRSVCEWYMAIGARPLFLAEGFSPAYTPRLPYHPTSDIGFIGASYGRRREYIERLRRWGLDVTVAGPGWHNHSFCPPDKLGQFLASCKVQLGIGGVGYSNSLKTLKGRDFEATGAGAAYLTSYNPDLASFFHIGSEILCYNSFEEMLELAVRVVRDDALRSTLAAHAYDRSMRCHRWKHRFLELLSLLGILEECGPGHA